GAVISHVFVYRWFGLGALLIPIIPITAGWRLLTNDDRIPLATVTKHTLFYTLWISLAMGYYVMMGGNSGSLGYLSGGFGFEANTLLFSLLKWGSVVVIVLLLFFHLIATLNIRSFAFLENITFRFPNKKKEEEELEESEVDDEKSPFPNLFQVEKEEDPTPSPTIEVPKFIEKSRVENTEIQMEVPSNGKVSQESPSERSVQLELELEKDPIPPLTQLPDKSLSEGLVEEFGEYDSTLDLPTFVNPGLDLLTPPQENQQEKVSHEELESNKNRIVETLGSYGIRIAKIKATIGPTVTLYEIIPEAGVRISKIQSLEKDIALNLAALGIRIIAPMPGRGTIGIEVPNKRREMVYIRTVFANERFQKSNYDLPVVLGKTISNEIYIADLAKMPHLLIAGATGQGKSVGLNVLLASLVFRKHPSQLKFVLVDPKKVELTLYNHLERHYLAKLPNSEEAIITDTKKVIYTLNSLCIEMDNRYDLLKEAAVRNLKEYNTKFVERKLNPQKGHRFLPFIVLVIDELADLMMTAGKEVETPIARVAQLARAVGIHLVIATQRPSVNIITGTIKANFPARLAFRVLSKIDSRTILDTGGADQLIGRGDMLLSTGSDLIRIQCAFVDTPEVERVSDFIGAQRGYPSAWMLPEYIDENAESSSKDFDAAERDSFFEEAARLIVMHQQGSTSLIQRKLKLGYNRAGRIIDQLEAAGIVGPFEGSKAREVLISDESSLEQFLGTLNNKE